MWLFVQANRNDRQPERDRVGRSEWRACSHSSAPRLAFSLTTADDGAASRPPSGLSPARAYDWYASICCRCLRLAGCPPGPKPKFRNVIRIRPMASYTVERDKPAIRLASVGE